MSSCRRLFGEATKAAASHFWKAASKPLMTLSATQTVEQRVSYLITNFRFFAKCQMKSKMPKGTHYDRYVFGEIFTYVGLWYKCKILYKLLQYPKTFLSELTGMKKKTDQKARKDQSMVLSKKKCFTNRKCVNIILL